MKMDDLLIFIMLDEHKKMYRNVSGKKLGTHSQDCTLYKFLQPLLCVLQLRKSYKVHIFTIVEVTAVHISHYFKVK